MKKTLLLLISICLFFAAFKISYAFDNYVAGYSYYITDYNLPYPGLLPDNPFYFLKMTRDGIVGMFISSPSKKAEFDILQADKRLNAGLYLFLRGDKKYDLALSTISKGQNYYDDAIGKLIRAKEEGEGPVDTIRKLNQSLKNQNEILKKLEKNFGKDVGKKLDSVQKRTESLQIRSNKLSS